MPKIVDGENTTYLDLGADWLIRRRSPEHQISRLVRQIQNLGAEVQVITPAA